MKRLLILLLLPLLTGCTALPAEERAFAVVLGAAWEDAEWTTMARIPTYQSGGGYATITGHGATLDAAMADMDAAAPMQLHLGQLRLLVLHVGVAESGELLRTLTTLADRADMRLQAAVAVTQDALPVVMEAMKPGSGARLSKSIDVLLDTRIEQGSIPEATLADVVRMGERQTPVLAALTIRDGAPELLGGWPMTHEGKLALPLELEEMQLLSLLQGRVRSLRLTMSDASADVREITANASLSGEKAAIRLSLRTVRSSLTTDALEAALARESLRLLENLYAQGCDVLGLGRQAIRKADNMAEWHALNWPDKSRTLTWQIAVEIRPGT